MIVRPPALRRGDTIAIVSTSWGGAGLLSERFERGLEALGKLGYRVVFNHSYACAASRGIEYQTPEQQPAWV